jgi:hypothetical protein
MRSEGFAADLIAALARDRGPFVAEAPRPPTSLTEWLIAALGRSRAVVVSKPASAAGVATDPLPASAVRPSSTGTAPASRETITFNLNDLVGAISATPPTRKLAVRGTGHAFVAALLLGRSLRAVEERDSALVNDLHANVARIRDLVQSAGRGRGRPDDRTRRLARTLAVDLSGDLFEAHHSGNGRAIDIAGSLSLVLARLLVSEVGIDIPVASVGEFVQKLLNVSGTTSVSLARGTPDDITRLRISLDEFAGADLRDADLTDVPLEGVRWSKGTRWPEGWKDQIEYYSVSLGNGLFEIRPGTSFVDGSLLATP